MRCGQLQDWLRELTAYPTPRKIAEFLQGELAAVDAGAEGGSEDSAVRRHLRRCERCHGRVRRTLKYWSLLALFCRDVTPRPSLERRVAERIRAQAAAPDDGAGLEHAASAEGGLLRKPERGGIRPRAALLQPAAEAAATAEEQRLYRDAGGAIPAVGWLLALAGARGGADWTLAPGENVIGRDEGCDLRIDDGSLAARHASIVCAVGSSGVAYFVLDHGSGTGTYLNGGDERIAWARLEDNDVLRLGSVRFKFKALAGVPSS